MALDLNPHEACMALQLDPDQLTDAVLREPLAHTHPPGPPVVGNAVSAQAAVDLMRDHHAPAVVICDPRTGRLQGLLTERDVLRLWSEGIDLARTPIQDVMTANPFCHGPWDSIGYALNKMVVDGYRTIPLIDADGRPVGLVTRAHLLRHLCRYLQAEHAHDAENTEDTEDAHDDVGRERKRQTRRDAEGESWSARSATA